MVRQLVEAYEAVVRTARDVLTHAGVPNDAATADLATQRLQVHEKTAWRLRSSLDPASESTYGSTAGSIPSTTAALTPAGA